jgi:hypothetical protein
MHEQTHSFGPVTLVFAIAAGLVIGGLALGAAIWFFGIVAGLIFALLRVAVLVGLAVVVVWGVRTLFRDHSRA